MKISIKKEKAPFGPGIEFWINFRVHKIRYAIRVGLVRDFWFEWWTPGFHQGRGPYISLGFYLFAIYRGY